MIKGVTRNRLHFLFRHQVHLHVIEETIKKQLLSESILQCSDEVILWETEQEVARNGATKLFKMVEMTCTPKTTVSVTETVHHAAGVHVQSVL